jgi:glycosyltransferase involved in cell wall biosynthesis
MKRISIVIPCYNNAHVLGDALRSCALQTFPPWEVIVVDDGSVDDVAAVCRGFPGVRLLRQPNRGLSGARNRGAREATGSHLVFLDADDLQTPETLAAFSVVDADIVVTAWRETDMTGVVIAERGLPALGDARDAFHVFAAGNVAAVHAFCVSRAVFNAVGGFDETLHALEDWDFWLRATAASFRCDVAVGGCAVYRRHPASMSTNLTRMVRNACRVLRRAAVVHPGCAVCAEAFAVARRRERSHWAWHVRHNVLRGVRELATLALADPRALLWLLSPTMDVR